MSNSSSNASDKSPRGRPFLRVVSPARNEEDQLPQLLKSIRAQDADASRVEVVVVDNGSTDRTAERARESGASVVLSDARTIAAARNEGARGAQAALLAFLDADVTIEDGWLEAAVAVFGDPEVVAAGSYPPAPDEGSTWVQRAWSFLVRRPEGRREVSWLPSANMLVRRVDFEALGGFDETLVSCEDADLSYRLGTRGKVVDDSALAARHHREPRNLWRFFLKEMWHGRDSYARLAQSGLHRSEIPSLALPLWSFLALLLSLAGLVLGLTANWWWIFGLGCLGFWLPPLAYTMRAVLTKGSLQRSPQFVLLYGVYAMARTLALLGWMHRRA